VAERKQPNQKRTYSDAGADPLSGQLTYSWLVPAFAVGCIPNAQVRLSHQASQEVIRNSRSNRATTFNQTGISSPRWLSWPSRRRPTQVFSRDVRAIQCKSEPSHLPIVPGPDRSALSGPHNSLWSSRASSGRYPRRKGPGSGILPRPGRRAACASLHGRLSTEKLPRRKGLWVSAGVVAQLARPCQVAGWARTVGRMIVLTGLSQIDGPWTSAATPAAELRNADEITSVPQAKQGGGPGTGALEPRRSKSSRGRNAAAALGGCLSSACFAPLCTVSVRHMAGDGTDRHRVHQACKDGSPCPRESWGVWSAAWHRLAREAPLGTEVCDSLQSKKGNIAGAGVRRAPFATAPPAKAF
jgi:hypothetical protein